MNNEKGTGFLARYWSYIFCAIILVYAIACFYLAYVYSLWMSAIAVIIAALATQFAAFAVHLVEGFLETITESSNRSISVAIKKHLSAKSDPAQHAVRTFLAQYASIWSTCFLTLGGVIAFMISPDSVLPRKTQVTILFIWTLAFLAIIIGILFFRTVTRTGSQIENYLESHRFVMPLNVITVIRGSMFVLLTVMTMLLEYAGKPLADLA